MFYTGTAVASKAYTVLGYSTWESGLAAVGTWNTAPSRTQLFGPGVKLPNDRVQTVMVSGGGLASSSGSYTDTTNGSVAITLSSAANVTFTKSSGQISVPATGGFNYYGQVQLLMGATTIETAISIAPSLSAGGVGLAAQFAINGFNYPNSGSAVTYKLQQVTSNQGETVTTSKCFIQVEEVMV